MSYRPTLNRTKFSTFYDKIERETIETKQFKIEKKVSMNHLIQGEKTVKKVVTLNEREAKQTIGERNARSKTGKSNASSVNEGTQRKPILKTLQSEDNSSEENNYKKVELNLEENLTVLDRLTSKLVRKKSEDKEITFEPTLNLKKSLSKSRINRVDNEQYISRDAESGMIYGVEETTGVSGSIKVRLNLVVSNYDKKFAPLIKLMIVTLKQLKKVNQIIDNNSFAINGYRELMILKKYEEKLRR